MINSERANEIANLYYNDIYHLCLSRLKKEEDACDVTQEVFLFFQENYSELEDDYIKSWLYAVADNKIKEQFRAIAKREKELIFGMVSGSQTSNDILYEMEEVNKLTAEELEEKKKSILSSLSEKELELFEMVYVKHMEYKELAKALDVSEHAVRARVYRLRLKIKEKAAFIFMAILLLFMRF
ncbi:MAG: sigma-70 family RNA polymerase sigma factor [Acutalibacteraceae bacterium]|nr:sigma-70 family RNA polymerase sigma factor [Acutalibacteraceae bacterium]